MMLEACVGKFVGESSVLGKLRIAAEFAGIRVSACVVVECLKRITITIVLVTIIIFVVAIIVYAIALGLSLSLGLCLHLAHWNVGNERR